MTVSRLCACQVGFIFSCIACEMHGVDTVRVNDQPVVLPPVVARSAAAGTNSPRRGQAQQPESCYHIYQRGGNPGDRHEPGCRARRCNQDPPGEIVLGSRASKLRMAASLLLAELLGSFDASLQLPSPAGRGGGFRRFVGFGSYPLP